TRLVLAGGASDKAFVVGVLERPELDAGTADPAWLDDLVARGDHLSGRGAEVALLAAATLAYERRIDAAKERFLEAAERGRPEVLLDGDGSIELRLAQADYLCRV